MKNFINNALSIATVLTLSLTTSSFAENTSSDTDLKIGMSTALTGKNSFLGTSFLEGANSYINLVNEQGGIKGKKLKIIARDDKYEPDTAIINVYNLSKKDKVFCLLGDVGTPTTMAIKSLLKREKLPLIAPLTGAKRLRNPVHPYIINYRASYGQEVETFLKGAVDKLGKKSVSVFYQDDTYGRGVFKATQEALKKRGLSVLTSGSYKRNTTDIDEGFKKVFSKNPQVVVMVGTYAPCAAFIQKAKDSNHNSMFMNVSFVGSDRLNELLGLKGNGVIVTQVVPNPNSDFPVIKEYNTNLKKYYAQSKPNFVSLEGYLATKALIEVMKKMPTLDKEALIPAFENTTSLDLGDGNELSFSTKNHQGSNKVYPTIIKNGKFESIFDWTKL
ncbi:MAG: ABC transporter substrate-binding protein [Candidatus Sericytochromatia bacterium]|nr:ABC transporter substrate-binding protein [Candidatus Sericytochromatia bacterium]